MRVAILFIKKAPSSATTECATYSQEEPHQPFLQICNVSAIRTVSCYKEYRVNPSLK